MCSRNNRRNGEALTMTIPVKNLYVYTDYPDISFLPVKWPRYSSRQNLISKYTLKNNGLKGFIKRVGVIDGRPIIFIMRPQAS